jgi:hypothetical protein
LLKCVEKLGYPKDGNYGLQIADGGVVRDRIKWDDIDDGQLPLLVIDGREIDWNEFGRMLMSHEGAQFKLTIADVALHLNRGFRVYILQHLSAI